MAFDQQDKFPDYGATNSDEHRQRSTSNTTLCNQLCDNIIYNIQNINNLVGALERACREIGTHADSEVLKDQIHDNRQSANKVIGSTTRFLKELKRAVRTEGRNLHLQAERLEREFFASVNQYDMVQKQLVPKMKQALQLQKPKTDDLWGIQDDDNEKESLIEAENLQQQKQLQEDLEFEHGLLLEREQRIQQIEADILDVNQIFRDLGALVHEQGDMIGTIEENISHTAENVQSGAQQLSKASEYQKKYRAKLCWLILILMLVAGVITIVVVVSTKT